MTVAAHERYRERLELLAVPPAPSYTRHFGRFHPDRESWATVVEAGPGGAPAMLTTALFDPAAAPADAVDHPAGPARVRPFPADPALPALAAVVGALRAVDIVRYRPGRRCTLRVASAAGGHYGKVLGRGEAQRLYGEALQLWHAAASGTLGFRVARPVGWDAASNAVWHDEVPGNPVAPLLCGPEAPALAHRLGAALARLAYAPVVPALRTGRAEQMARTARAVARVDVTVPDVAAALRAHLARLGAAAAQLPPERLLVIHGSPHAHQWLVDDERGLALVDFDRMAVGEAELDGATLLGELETERGLTTPLPAIEAALAAGYAHHGVPLEGAVVEWYRAHKRIAKVVRTAFALRPDGDRRAARLVAALTAAS